MRGFTQSGIPQLIKNPDTGDQEDACSNISEEFKKFDALACKVRKYSENWNFRG